MKNIFRMRPVYFLVQGPIRKFGQSTVVNIVTRIKDIKNKENIAADYVMVGFRITR